jgi:hypothetical protein
VSTILAIDAYKGEIQQRENIGKTSADLVALWNKEHPDDRWRNSRGHQKGIDFKSKTYYWSYKGCAT